MRSHSDSKGFELKRPNDSIYTFPCPDCMSRKNRTTTPDSKPPPPATWKHTNALASLPAKRLCSFLCNSNSFISEWILTTLGPLSRVLGRQRLEGSQNCLFISGEGSHQRRSSSHKHCLIRFDTLKLMHLTWEEIEGLVQILDCCWWSKSRTAFGCSLLLFVWVYFAVWSVCVLYIYVNADVRVDFCVRRYVETD